MSTLEKTVNFLEGLANTLDGWAEASTAGGWSTHQVKANRDAANDCRRHAAQLRAEIGRKK
jgi:hypothetical protein